MPNTYVADRMAKLNFELERLDKIPEKSRRRALKRHAMLTALKDVRVDALGDCMDIADMLGESGFGAYNEIIKLFREARDA